MSFEVERLTPMMAEIGQVRISHNGITESIHFALADCTLHYAVGSVSRRLQDLTYEPATASSENKLDGALRSPINGRVLALPVAESTRALAGQPLVVLEAMKMEHSLVLPVTVMVDMISVRVGSQVAPGDLLLQYERAALPDS